MNLKILAHWAIHQRKSLSEFLDALGTKYRHEAREAYLQALKGQLL